MELTPGIGQSIADIDANPQRRVYATVYYAPEAWTEVKVDPMTGGDVTVLKDGYLTPDGLYLWHKGEHSTEPNPAQLDPVDLESFVWIRPHEDATAEDFGYGKRQPWSSEHEPGGMTAYVPDPWINHDGEVITNQMTAHMHYPIMDGYLTPGVLSLIAAGADTEIPVPAPTRDGLSYTLPSVEGVEWTVNGDPVEPGTYDVEVGGEPVTVIILPTTLDGYVFTSDPEPVEYVFTAEPDPEPDPEPGDDGTDAGTRMMLAALKRPYSAEAAAELSVHYQMVRLFVMEYTRERGFTPAGRPKGSLMAVIVAGAIRLAMNPEQAAMYALDSITVRPAVFQGYTLAEQGVLHRYRKRSA